MKLMIIAVIAFLASLLAGGPEGGIGYRRRLVTIWGRVRSGPLGARPSALTSLPRSTWAVLKRVGVKFPAASYLLPGQETVVGFSRRPRAANRYLAHQFLRLERAAEARNAKLFWTVATRLVTRSCAYRMAVLHKCLPF